MPAYIDSQHPSSLLRFSCAKHLPVILQTEAAECGLACLAMIADFYGYQTDLTQLRLRYCISSRGASLKQMMDIAGQLNMTSRALKLDVNNINQLTMPCILHWQMKHFVVIKACHPNYIEIHDPAVGKKSVRFSEVNKLFTGIALELTPNAQFEMKNDQQSLSFQHFWSTIGGLKRSLALVLVLSLLLQVFSVTSPLFMQIAIDEVILRNDIDLLTALAFGFGLLLLVEIGTTVLRQIAILHLSSKLSIQITSNVFFHLIRLPVDYFNKRHIGDIVNRFESLSIIRELLTTGLVTAIIDGVMAIITLTVMFMYDMKLTLIVIAVVCLYMLIRYFFYRPIRLLNEESMIATARENSHFMESMRAIQTIKLFEDENNRQNQWLNFFADAINKNIQITQWDISFNAANRFLFGLENILIIFFAAMAVIDSVFSVGMLYAFISYKTRFINAMDGLITQWIEFRMLELHFKRLADIVLTKKDELIDSPQLQFQGASTQTILGGIAINQIEFRYSALDKPIFSQISLTIMAGETVAIVGKSGSGKTTLLKCIMGLTPIEKGEISIDGVPIKQCKGYRSQIAAVLQDDQLLSGSIADNISCFTDQLDMDRVIWAAQLACIDDDIKTFSMQYNTLVGDMGTSLSGGQKQRIIVARALYRQPAILFMDEATSHLDINNESRLTHHLNRLKITRIIVAHRIETIASADRVFELVEGRLQQVAINDLINIHPHTSMEGETL